MPGKARRQKKKPEVEFEATTHTTPAGYVVKGEALSDITPVRLGLGGGLLRFYYLPPQMFLGPNAELEGDLGRGTIYSRVAYAYLPKTARTVPQHFQAFTLGTEWDVTTKKPLITFGTEVTGRVSEARKGINQLVGEVAAGLAVHYNPLTFYGLSRMSIVPKSPMMQGFSDVFHLAPYEVKAGIVASPHPKLAMTTELETGPARKRVTTMFSLGFIKFSPEIGFHVGRTSEIFGGAMEAGLMVSLSSGAIRVNSRHDFGHEVIPHRHPKFTGYDNFRTLRTSGSGPGGWSTSHTEADFAEYAGIVSAQYAFVNGEMSQDDFARFNDPAAVSMERTGEGSYRVTEADGNTYTLIVDRDHIAEILDEHKKHAGIDVGRFYHALYTSGTLDEFAANYKDASFKEKIRAAAALSAYGHDKYAEILKGASVFATARSKIHSYSPDRVYTYTRQYVLEQKDLSTGNCVNINGLAVEFLRRSGVEAYSVVMGTPARPHGVAVARNPAGNQAYLVDYGVVYNEPGRGIWPVVEAYQAEIAQYSGRGINILGVYVYQKGNWDPVFYKGPEGEMMDTVLGEKDKLKRTLIRKKRKK